MVYVGSKSRIAQYIVPILQKIIYENKINYFIDCFVGGANIIDKVICLNRIGYDIHEGLIGIYNAVQSGWTPPLHITEQDYIDAKNGKIEEPLRSYIGFNGSYASKYWGGYARGFKSDDKTPRDIYDERTRNFIKQIPFIKNSDFIKFECKNYRNIVFSSQKSLCYCDIPYKNTTEYSNKRFNHDEFWSWVRLVQKEHIMVISEFEAPDDFQCIWSKERYSSLDKNTGGKKNTEKLFIKI